ncbi:SseB family protein [Agromyces seonyuensis]|uniref:SseB family protein n=1 Tax=Agromyces seonyuensis TaxID=2662446 RepID=A0A6I4P595_9MICO|nr:SseB family protein [Agromyces seonyuensis]MWB99579.1 SseB family protein [Agromyces seonyuensis]
MSPATDPHRAPGAEGQAWADAHTPGGHGDSAGQPWAGRSFESNPFAGDDGTATPALALALEDFAAGTRGPEAVVDAFRAARLLIPLVAHAGDGGTEIGAHGLAVDKSQELSIVTVAGPDGRNVLPVFSSVATMQAWSPTSRPVPADGGRVALAAVDDGTELVVLDPGSPSEFAIRRPAVWAVAQSAPWTHPARSPEVRDGFLRSIASELAVVDVELEPGDRFQRLVGPELVVRLRLVQGLTRAELDSVLRRLAERWAADEAVATLVDSLTVKLAPAAD